MLTRVLQHRTEPHSRVPIILLMYSEGSEFKSQPEHQLSWQIFRGYLHSLRANTGIVPQTKPRQLFPATLQFIIH
jgi:hypothetical protein